MMINSQLSEQIKSLTAALQNEKKKAQNEIAKLTAKIDDNEKNLEETNRKANLKGKEIDLEKSRA